MGRFLLSNSVTLATRVRLEILRLITKECSSVTEDYFGIGFTTRPVLQVKQKVGVVSLPLPFSRYGGRVGELDLCLANE